MPRKTAKQDSYLAAVIDRQTVRVSTPVFDELEKAAQRMRFLHDGKPSIPLLLRAISQLSHRHLEEMLDDAELLPTPYGHDDPDEEPPGDYFMPDC